MHWGKAITPSTTAALAAAVAELQRGAVVAFPTETYYGLAVDALDLSALERLFALKGRGAEKTSALIVADLAMLAALCAEIPEKARELATAHWPGPLTLALPARPGLPEAIVQDGFVAARVSLHPLAHALVLAFGRPITATSANPAGAAPTRLLAEVRAYFGSVSPFVLDGGETPGGLPSTLVRVRGDAVEVVRQGAIRL
jgi:L-threonylcarbamoyladenylate synthase